MGWQSNVFQLLIIEDTGGFSGLFLYKGAPGPGTLIASITSAADTDPFGNTYKGPGLFFYSTFDHGYVGLTQSNTGQALIEWGDTEAGTSPPSIELTVNDLSIGWGGTGGTIILSAGNPGICTIPSPVFAIDGTPAVPTLIQTDSWNPFTLLAGTSAGTDTGGNTYTPGYKLQPDGDVALRGVVVAPAGGLPAGTTWGTVPAAYRPGTNIPPSLVSNGGTGTLAHVYIRPNGNVQFDQNIGAGIAMWIDTTLHIQGS